MSVREEMASWARDVLTDPITVILDTETTGLHGYVCEIAVLGRDKEFLLNTLVNPLVPVEPGAQRIHGLGADELAGAFPFDSTWPALEKIIATRRVIVYNAEFDSAVIRRELARMKVAPPALRWECAMVRYSDWSAGYYDARYLRLNGGHRAAEDCWAVYRRLHEMAESS